MHRLAAHRLEIHFISHAIHNDAMFVKNFDDELALVGRGHVLHRCIRSHRLTHFQLLVSRSLRWMIWAARWVCWCATRVAKMAAIPDKSSRPSSAASIEKRSSTKRVSYCPPKKRVESIKRWG